MSRLIFNRFLLIVHGQDDELETPTRYFRTHCSGCKQGCEFYEAEIANDIGLDEKRVIQPPPPLSDDARARFNRLALYLSALGFGVIAGLLEAFGASPFNKDLL